MFALFDSDSDSLEDNPDLHTDNPSEVSRRVNEAIHTNLKRCECESLSHDGSVERFDS